MMDKVNAMNVVYNITAVMFKFDEKVMSVDVTSNSIIAIVYDNQIIFDKAIIHTMNEFINFYDKYNCKILCDAKKSYVFDIDCIDVKSMLDLFNETSIKNYAINNGIDVTSDDTYQYCDMVAKVYFNLKSKHDKCYNKLRI
jgi:hypothetical protein